MRGRPTLFKPEYVEQGYQLALLGLTDADMARVWGVCEDTINNWKMDHFDFIESINRGKDQADALVADKLFKRATGYSHPAVKIFNNDGTPLVVDYTEQYPPDTGAAIFWLKNRQRRNWRDKQEVESTSTVTMEATVTQKVAIDFSDVVDGE